MSSSSSHMDFQKPVKVKSRWTQSCQMEMMMEEPQSSLDNMSDTVTDVSTSETNGSTDNSFEPNCLELRRSRRTGSNRTDYRQLNGSKKNRQKPSTTSLKTSNKKGRKRKDPLNTPEVDKDCEFENNIRQESNIIGNPSIDWNNIIICPSSRRSRSVNNISEIGANLPLRPIRRQASLKWGFKYTLTDDIEDNNNILEKENCSNVLNGIIHLNINETGLQTSSSTDDKQLCKDNKLTNKESTKNENISQQPYSDINALNSRGFEQRNEVLTVEFNEISVTNSNKQKQPDEWNILVNQCDKENVYQMNCLVIPKSYSSELKNLILSPINKFREIRSKSSDSLMINTNSHIKRSKSCDDINKLDDSMVDVFKLQKSRKKTIPKKRRQSKRIKYKTNSIEIPDDIQVPEVNYNQVADEIYREHQNQLIEARIKDKEFDKKLESTNFTLVTENIYRPNKHALKACPPSEVPALRKLKQRVISGDINDYCECTLSKEDIKEGNIGCDDRCLNRLLKVECGSGCSLKRYCTNKQFQNKQFKRTNIIKTENKGYGICAVEDIPKGVLINEFVGEVIDYNEMCKRLRKKEYKNKNFLVQLNSDEIIDSTSKGNMTRFINHSCNPNAVGEKWYVLGQSRIGFFSIRHIKKGEEITFDYSFQIFGDNAQVCYCGSSNCRGYISKASQITDVSSSEDSDATENHFTSRPEEKQKRKRIYKKRTVQNNNKLRELSRQLTEIARLKTGLKADQEMATLNLNRLMVHITDSVSRLHVLTFIRGHDMNKRLFMDFSGLSIIHNWMTSNENESFKLMILEILAELPITNRNTITKSKVLDVVAEWANIPQDIKTKFESLEYPTSDLQDIQEIDKILPTNNENDETDNLVEKARALWKKWIVLKIIFKIPKKIDQHKPNIEINSTKFTENSYPYPMEITTLEPNMYRIPNKYFNKVQNPQTVPIDRIKLRKEYKPKVDQNKQQMFRKKVMDDWYEKRERVLGKKPDQSVLDNSRPLNHFNSDNPKLNHNNGIIDHTKWNYSSQIIPTSQNTVVNYNMQMPCLNFMPPQQQYEFPQYSYVQTQTFPNYQPSFFNIPPPPLHSHTFVSQPQKPVVSLNKSANQNTETPEKLTVNIVKSAEAQVFNLINESLRKHHSEESKNVDTETKHSNTCCSRTVQCGADLLARIKVISNSFKNQPSKLIKIRHTKQHYDKSKLEKVAMTQSTDVTTDVPLQSFCDTNKRIIFMNEQTGVTSNTISEDLIPNPKTISLSEKNKFGSGILNSLFKKVVVKPEKFVLPKLDSVDTIDETHTEIELYKKMRPKITKKVVAHIETKDGFVPVIKRQRGIKLKGLKENHEKIPATMRNIMRKGNLHRKITLQNGLVNRTKSALKRQNSNIGNNYLKKPKEKRVTFQIEGEASPIFPHSEVRPINLNQNTLKQKPLMKCHPFEIRNDPKLSTSTTSTTEGDNPLEQSSDSTNYDPIIAPIVSKFKASRNRRISLRNRAAELEQLRSQRKHMIPASMMSLPVDVLKLIPDNKKEMKKVIDFYHSMATVIVKTLGSYAKKTCQQGRIRNDEDFKYLAKKLNENVLLKELQCKRVDKLKINNSTKEKVAEYIRKYMSRFGEVYKRKPNEQSNNHKAK